MMFDRCTVSDGAFQKIVVNGEAVYVKWFSHVDAVCAVGNMLGFGVWLESSNVS
jgi:hypothetical protein